MAIQLAIVNCYVQEREKKITAYRQWVVEAATALGIDLQPTLLDEDEIKSWPQGLDGYIISGSFRMIGQGQFSEETIRFIASNQKPLLGICYGHQLLARSFGAEVGQDRCDHNGFEDVRRVGADEIFRGFPEVFPMRQSHREIVIRDERLTRHFMVLAENREQKIEVIRHRHRPSIGVQFHPERSGEWGQALIRNFLTHFLPPRPI